MPLFFYISGIWNGATSFWWLLWAIGKYHSRNHNLFPYELGMIIGRQACRFASNKRQLGGRFPGHVHENMLHYGGSWGLPFSTGVRNQATATTDSLLHPSQPEIALKTLSFTLLQAWLGGGRVTACADSAHFPLAHNVHQLSIVCVSSTSSHWEVNLTRINTE